MALVGTLTDFSLVDIFQLVALGQKTGTVVIRGRRADEPIEGRVFFVEGDVFGADCAGMAGEEAVYTLFLATEGDFEFVESPPTDARTIELSNEAVIIEAITRQEAWSRVEKRVFPIDMPISLRARPSDQRAQITLEPDTWQVIVALRGIATIGEIIERSGLSRFRVIPIVAELIDSGLAEAQTIIAAAGGMVRGRFDE
jgi:hypothetical protein